MRRKLIGICLIMILALSACGKKAEQDAVTSGKHTETAAERTPGEAGTVQASPSPAAAKATATPKATATATVASNATAAPKATAAATAASNATATPKAAATATATPKATTTPTATPKATATATATPKATAAPTATPAAKETAKATATPAAPNATVTPKTTETSQTTGASESKEQTTASTPTPTEAPHTHTFVDQTVSEATCTEGKVVESVCSVCGASNGTRTEGGALGHDTTEEYWYGGPTCTHGDYVNVHCSRCNQYIDAYNVDPIEHDWEESSTTGCDCITSGVTRQTCRNCGASGDSWENGQYGDHTIDTWEVKVIDWETNEEHMETVTECTLCGQSF